MFTFLKKSLPTRGKIPIEEKWTADFSKLENFPFDIKPESSHDAYPSGNLIPVLVNELGELDEMDDLSFNPGTLGLCLKKAEHLSWIETPERYYEDQIIEARFRLDSRGGYAATGLLFRLVNRENYYIALISSTGCFRLDVVKGGSSVPLIGWIDFSTVEAGPGYGEGRPVNLSIIACGAQMIFLIDGRWIGEAKDESLSCGRLGFALASYKTGKAYSEAENGANPYTCRAWLESLSVDSRRKKAAACCGKWNDNAAVPAESRIRLAECCAAGNAAAPALAQITKVWEQRNESARSVSATYTEIRAKKELLLAARAAVQLEDYANAEEYFNACLEQGWDTPEAREVVAEKTKLLVTQNNFQGLKKFIPERISRGETDPGLYALLGNALWNLGEFESAAGVWDSVFELDRENGLYVVNAAKAYECLGKNEEALSRYLTGGRVFLRQNNREEINLVVPKLLSLGEQNWEALALAGKLAYSTGDFEQAGIALALAEKVRRKQWPVPPADPALVYMRGLLLIRKDKLIEALPFLEEAAGLAPDYGMFRFKLAETRYLLSGIRAPGLTADMKAALSLMPDDGWVHNFAAQLIVTRKTPKAVDLAAAEDHLQKAGAALGEIPAVKVNRAALCYLRGSIEGALKILASDKTDDPEGLMVYYTAMLLSRSGDFEKADAYYRKALAIAPDNFKYLSGCVTTLMQRKLFEEAENLLLEAQKKNPSPEILELLNQLREKKKPRPGRSSAKAASPSKTDAKAAPVKSRRSGALRNI